eukprot:235873-Pelagomonas_calceolata.AAC.2
MARRLCSLHVNTCMQANGMAVTHMNTCTCDGEEGGSSTQTHTHTLTRAHAHMHAPAIWAATAI